MEEKKTFQLVVVESPYAGDVATNLTYARACMRDCFARGEAPFASHLLFTQDGVLDDLVPAEREQGIEAGLRWGERASLVAVYVDRGISPGMRLGIGRHLGDRDPETGAWKGNRGAWKKIVEGRSLEGNQSAIDNFERNYGFGDVLNVAGILARKGGQTETKEGTVVYPPLFYVGTIRKRSDGNWKGLVRDRETNKIFNIVTPHVDPSPWLVSCEEVISP